MSDSLLPEEEKEYEYEDDGGVFEELKKRIQKALSFLSEIRESENDEEEDEDSSPHGTLSFKENEEESEDSFRDKIDRFTIIVVSVEVILVIYFILALLGFVPFF